MLFQGFVHPFLLWGALAASVPLLIHLFNRQRHRPTKWAAMKFVMAAYRRTRRRAQLENLLLLLLRMAAVALLALAIARPFTGDDSPLAPLTESRRDLVLVIDTSASTGYREGTQSVHERIVERARTLLEEFDGARGDRVRLYAAASRPRMISSRSPEEGITLLSTLTEPTDEEFDLASVLSEVVDYAEEEAAGTEQSSVEIRLLTDLQRGAFATRAQISESADGEGGEDLLSTGPALLDRALDRLLELGVRIVVEDLGPGIPTPANLGLADVAPIGTGLGDEIPEVRGAGVPVEFGVAVQNFGTKARGAVRVTLELEGGAKTTQQIDVPARGRAEAVFQVVFPSAGAHTLVASLEGDGLEVDDTRTVVVRVPEPLNVLLVNGDPRAEVERDEVGILTTVLTPLADDEPALSASRAGGAPFQARAIDAATFGSDPSALQDADLIVLANVGSLSTRVFEALEARVASGAALIVTLGDQSSGVSSIEAFNARGWRADGTGLLPAKLERAVVVGSRREEFYRCATFDETHPGLRFFADERWRPFLTEVPIFGFVKTEPIPTARVLATLDDEDRSPLLLERPFGRGRVLLWTTSIDSDWNLIPESPSTLIPLVHELFRYAGRGPRQPLSVRIGESITPELTTFPRAATILQPDGARRPLDGEPTEVAEGRWEVPTLGPLEHAGAWRLEFEGGALPFSVGLSPEEGDLDRIGAEELENSHRAWRVFESGDDSSSDDGDESSERGELWRWLAALSLIALVLETLWAAWIGRARRLA